MSKLEEDDGIDELDDLIDEFAETVLSQPPGAALNKETAATSAQTAGSSDLNSLPDRTALSKDAGQSKSAYLNEPIADEPFLDDELAEKLEKGMDQLLQDMEQDPDAKLSFASLLSQLSKATGLEDESNAESKETGKPGDRESFKDTISDTINRLNESNKREAEAAAKRESSNEDPVSYVEDMIKELMTATGGTEGDLDGLLNNMLDEMSSKEILYEPMRELREQFPAWLEKHSENTSADDLTRYKTQQSISIEICQLFEDPNYQNSDEPTKKKIADAMQRLQEAGDLPKEIMGVSIPGSTPNPGCDVQ